MTQLLAGAGPYTLTKTWYVDGTATDVGAVTIGVVDGNGDSVVSSGTATTNNNDGTYTYSLASVANPDQLKVTWTRSDTSAALVERMEVIGSWLFTEAQARSFAAKADATTALKPLADSGEYPDSVIADERKRITDDFERWTGRSWVTRYARLELKGSGGSQISIRHGKCVTSDGYHLNCPGRYNDIAVVLSATVNGTAVDTADIEIDDTRQCLIRTDAFWDTSTTNNPFSVVVEYVYGLPYIAGGADRIALMELVDRLVPSAWPDRVLSADTEYGTTRFVQPGGPMGNRSRLPRVNDWVHNNDQRVMLG